ncbi:hypothetical protein Tco_0610353 [Tanacetum coccineum]
MQLMFIEMNKNKNKNKVGMRIPAWMITDEMKLTEHYKMYAEVFGLDVPLNQSQPTESTQRMHRTPSTPRSPNPATDTCHQQTKADEMILQDMIQHLAAEEIKKLVEDPDDSSPPRHDDTSIPYTRLEPRSDKESPKVEIVQEKEEETTKDTEVEPDKDTPMEKGEMGRILRRLGFHNSLTTDTRISLLCILDTEKLRIDGKTLSIKDTRVFFMNYRERYGYLYAHLRKRLCPDISDQLGDNLHDDGWKATLVGEKRKQGSKLRRKCLRKIRDQFCVSCRRVDSERKTTKMTTERLILSYPCKIYVGTYINYTLLYRLISVTTIRHSNWLAPDKFEKTQVPQTTCRSSAVRTRDQDDPHDDAHPEGENSTKKAEDIGE